MRSLKCVCAACSTGEEVYSFALLLEEFRRVHPKFDYRILGTDIDGLSLATAERAVYPKKQIGFTSFVTKTTFWRGVERRRLFYPL